MNHTILQRVLVRMLYDRAFQEAVYRDPATALAGLGLAPIEIAWLLESDPRAFRTDPLRRARGLRALLEEFPASAALASVQASQVQALDRFFSAPQFHAAIQARGSLALAFGRFLQALQPATQPLASIARLETEIATLRRLTLPRPRSPENLADPAHPSDPTAASQPVAPDAARSSGRWATSVERPADLPQFLGLAPHARLLEVPGGTLDLYQSLRARLAHFATDPVEALLHPKFRLRSIPSLRKDRTQALLVLRDPHNAIGLEEIPPALAGLLAAASPSCSRAQLLKEARRQGAEPGEDEDLLKDLVRDGLLVLQMET